jgi:hypothetical protein
VGRSLLIVLLGFAASFGILANGKNRRFMDSVNLVVNQFAEYAARNAATSGAYIALNKLYLNPEWRPDHGTRAFGGDTLAITVEDESIDPSLGPNRLRILSAGHNGDGTYLTTVVVFDGAFNEFAVWAKDNVANVITKDALNNNNPSLLVANAPYMPDIDDNDLVNDAASQGHFHAGDFEPPDDYPNHHFDYFGSTPNVTHIQGDLLLRSDRKIYGIFIVGGDAILEGESQIRGVLYLPNASSAVTHGGGGAESTVRGGIVTRGTIDGGSDHITVRHTPSYLEAFASNYVPSNPPVRVLSWQ